MSNYDAETINARNPIARYAHRNRVERSVGLALPLLDLSKAAGGQGRLLDFGCGSGVFVARILALRPGAASGFEPFMTERTQTTLPIVTSMADAADQGPYGLVTLFETIEHLTDPELQAFLDFAQRTLEPGGRILITAPIEIGPALFAKDANRFWLRGRRSEHGALELAKAAILGIAARRADDVKGSHRGFDFRQAMQSLRKSGWTPRILSYGPLPIPTWYGNSQVFMTAVRATPVR
jgi:2-polyprenyl-3-methyl-5-hydroxy-6-metoxy-1,4-benzoquinol methylase